MRTLQEYKEWDAFKSYIRDICIKLAWGKKNRGKKVKKILQEEIMKLEQEHKLTRQEEIALRLDQVKTKLKLLETKSVLQQILYAKQRAFQYVNKPVKSLANLLKSSGGRSKIPSILNKEGEEVILEVEKVKEFEAYYRSLYLRQQDLLKVN